MDEILQVIMHSLEIIANDHQNISLNKQLTPDSLKIIVTPLLIRYTKTNSQAVNRGVARWKDYCKTLGCATGHIPVISLGNLIGLLGLLGL